MQNLSFYILGIFTLFLATACQNNVVFNKYIGLDKSEWHYGEPVTVEIPMQDTVTKYNLFINLRNNKDYAYSNLFLITRMTFPDRNTRIVDTLEYEMTDARGSFLGSGFTDLKENKLFYKAHIQFPQTGNYTFEVKHAMRERNYIDGLDPLKGVTDVGISLEKTEN